MPFWISKTALVTAGISILAVSPCAAQGEIVPVPNGTKVPETFNPFDRSRKSSAIPLRNVKPRVMAFWLDPRNHPAPPESALPGAGESAVVARVTPHLPTGIDRIVPLDAQNALLVFGTEEGVRRLQEIINFLDKPVRHIEVEASLITIQSANLTGRWADLAAQATGQQSAMGLFPSSYRKELTELVARNQARIRTSRRRSLFDNTTQGFSFGPLLPNDTPSSRLTIPNRIPKDFSSPMPVIPPPTGMAQMPGMRGRITPQAPSALAPFERMILYVTPTIGDNSSVTLEVKSSGLGDTRLQGTATLRGGETLGFALPSVAGASYRAFVLMTPRIVRRAS